MHRYAKHWSFIPPDEGRASPKSSGETPRSGRTTKLTTSSSHLEQKAYSRLPKPIAARSFAACRSTSPASRHRPPTSKHSPPTKHPNAYEKLVDRLLASPHFGERMALVWLDAARYADTNGYSIDGGRQMWLWRDWVINAFNTNLPYDQFVRDQLAGDLVPNHTEAQQIATGFQRNNMNTHEGGTIPEENLANYNVDRVKTFGEAMLGLTLGCCQCHDHKYDPLKQRTTTRSMRISTH